MISASFRQLLALSLLASGIGIFAACSDDAPAESGGPPANDGGTSSTKDGASRSEDDAGTNSDDSGTNENDGGSEGGACGPIVTTPGETCVGFGADPETCDPACEAPYGYVCYEGAPPSFEGCRKASESALGQTYCCPKNDCVAQPDQDAMCNGTAGKPHRFQCPPNGSGGNVAPPAGCEEKGSGATEVEKYYCCP